MQWVDQFQFFLFDFDGLLVNTEHLHYEAYVQMLAHHGCALSWDFAKFCGIAHAHSENLRQQIYADFPSLDPNWARLYGEKKAFYQDLISQGKVGLMPGVEALLQCLKDKDIRRCVVTNSTRAQIDKICSQQPSLQTIPHWITREDYANPKPCPDGYFKAIELYGKEGDRMIGFEDTLRGILALKQTQAMPVLICPSFHPLLQETLSQGAKHFETFLSVSI
jgi:HAD superfamily hydrolase (TIGR01509 family)